MLAKRRVAQIPQVLVPDVDLIQVIRIVAEYGGQAVEHRHPVGHILLQQVFFRRCQVLVLHMAEGEHLADVAALFPDATELPGIPDGHGLLVDLPTDGFAVRVVAGRGQHDPYRLLPAGACAEGHNVPQLPVWLRMQLVEDHTAWLVAVLGKSLAGQDDHFADGDPLVSAVAGPHPLSVFDRPLRLFDFQLAPGQHLGGPRSRPEHIYRRAEHNAGVVLVGRADVYLSVQLTVSKQMVDTQSGRQLALSVFLGDLQIQVPILPQPLPGILIGFHGAVEIHDGGALPLVQGKRLTGVRGGQALHKVADKAPRCLVEVITGSCGHCQYPMAADCLARSVLVNSSASSSGAAPAALTTAVGTTILHRLVTDSPMDSAH